MGFFAGKPIESEDYSSYIHSFCRQKYGLICHNDQVTSSRCTFLSLSADNSSKTTILMQRWWHRAKEIILFLFPSSEKQHYCERACFCISATKESVHCLNTEVED